VWIVLKMKQKITKKRLEYWNSLKGKMHSKKHNVKISKTMKKMFKKGELKITGAAQQYHNNPKNHHRYIDGRSYKKSPYRYGDDWSAIRMLIYIRDNFTCQECGMNMHESEKKFNCPLHIHHKTPFLQSFDNSLKNLITLCKSCHLSVENKIRFLNKEVDTA